MDAARSDQIRALYRAALERPLSERGVVRRGAHGGRREPAQVRRAPAVAAGRDRRRRALRHRPRAGRGAAARHAIGQYRIDDVLGRGGIGVVYRATDTKLHRPVAIKFIVAAVADADARRRFKQEAETASALNHPHIVTVYDVGEHDGRQYIVSELVDGGTLERLGSRPRKRSSRQSVELLTGVADAIAAAHAAGVLHRDVKPGNILIGATATRSSRTSGSRSSSTTGAQRRRGGRRSTRATRRAGVVSARSRTCRPSRPRASRSTRAATCSRSASCSTRRVAGRRPFEAANDLEVLKSIAHAAPRAAARVDAGAAADRARQGAREGVRRPLSDDARLRRGPAAHDAQAARLAAEIVDGRARGARLSVARGGGLRARVRGRGRARGAVTSGASLRRPHLRCGSRFPSPGYVGGRARDVAERPAHRVRRSRERRNDRSGSGRSRRPTLARCPAPTTPTRPFWSPDSRSLAFYADGKLKRVDINGRSRPDDSRTRGRSPAAGNAAAGTATARSCSPVRAAAGGSTRSPECRLLAVRSRQ